MDAVAASNQPHAQYAHKNTHLHICKHMCKRMLKHVKHIFTRLWLTRRKYNCAYMQTCTRITNFCIYIRIYHVADAGLQLLHAIKQMHSDI